MRLENKREVESTRKKLSWLESEYESAKLKPESDPHVQELTLRSLRAMINQMKEEIARFESGVGFATRNS